MLELLSNHKPNLEEFIPENENEEILVYSIYSREAVFIFMNEYDNFKSSHKDVREFDSIAKYKDKKKIIRPLVFDKKKFPDDKQHLNPFLTAKIICIGIGLEFKKCGITNAKADVAAVKNDAEEVECLMIEMCIN